MKLLKEFKKQVLKLGRIKKVWLTSFNLNLEFVETHVLPVILDMEVPKDALDYEHLQKELSDKQIDCKIFCDIRMIDGVGNKRTSIEVFGINPGISDSFSKESLFHPKVIYLEDEDGKSILGSGSANLTLSGWGRNQEAFIFKKISDNKQAKQVDFFFSSLLQSEYKLSSTREYWGEDVTWKFIHSYQDKRFLQYLFDGDVKNELAIWSPYFPKDLSFFIDKLRQTLTKPDLKLYIIPDRVQGKFIRCEWSEELDKMIQDPLESLSFYQNPCEKADNMDLCHAKVWKTQRHLAIGSWNFTGPGSNLNNEYRNIEAGILLEELSDVQEGLENKIDIKQECFSSKKLLEQEALDIPQLLPFEVKVCFDWDTRVYSLDVSWAINEASQNYDIRLPDIDKPIPLNTENLRKVLEVEKVQELYVNRRFFVYSHDERVGTGFIIESKTEFRNVQCYASFEDLLNSYTVDTIIENQENTVVKHGLKSGLGDFENEGVQNVKTNISSFSYFRLFQATSVLGNRIRSIKTVEDVNRIIFDLPGCLQEFGEKIDHKTKSEEPSIFNWFLNKEYQSLVKIAQDHCEKEFHIKDESLISSTKWKGLIITQPNWPMGVPLESSASKYMSFINEECKYD